MALRDFLNWGDNVARLAAKLTAATERLNELKAEQRELSLAVAVEENGAEKRLEKVNANLRAAEQSVEGFQAALSLAQEKATVQKQSDAKDAAAERKRQIAATVNLHATNSDEIQKSITNLVEELAKHYALNKELAALVFEDVQADASLSDQEKQHRTHEANRLLGLPALEARLRYFAYSYRLPPPAKAPNETLEEKRKKERDLGIANFSLSTWLNAPPHDMNVTNKGMTFREIEKEIVDLAVFDIQPKARPKPKLVPVEPEPVRMDGTHLPEGPKRDIWLRNFNPQLLANRFAHNGPKMRLPVDPVTGLVIKDPKTGQVDPKAIEYITPTETPLAQAYQTLRGLITQDPKIIAEDKAERARKAEAEQQARQA